MKNMLITGGAGGIGRAVSEYFAKNGWKVYSCDISAHDTAHHNIIPVIMDLCSTESIKAARVFIEAGTTHLDVIINLAGIYIMDSLIEVSEQDFINMFDINVNGAYRVNREFFPLVRKGGRIIIITSELSCLNPLPFNGIYSITKKTLEAYAFSLRLELALIGVPVITIRPGAVDTGLLKESFSSMERMCRNTGLYRMSASKFHQVMKKMAGSPMPPEKLARTIYSAAVTRNPRTSYTIGAGTALRMFSALPANAQAAILKKLLK